MAFSNPVTVASATSDNISPKVMTYSGQPGRIYLACLGRYQAADTFTAVSDNAGNTWSRVATAPASGTTGRRIDLWICKPTVAFSTVTVTFTGTTIATASLVEIQGGTGVVNASAAIERASSATPAALTITPTKANTMVVAIVQANSNNTSAISTTGDWTPIGSALEGPKIVYRYAPPANSPVGASWTFSVSQGSGHAIVALEEDSSPWFLWDGTTEVPLNLDGVWNGSTIDPCMFDTVVGTPPPAQSMLVGLDCLPQNMAADFAAFPGVMYHRDFGSDNLYGSDADTLTEPTPFNTGTRWANLPQGATMHISWKDDPALFTNFLDSIPDTPPAWFTGVYVSPWHEPHDDVRDGTFTTAQFRAWGATLTSIKNTHPKGNWVLGVGPILTRYDLDEAPVRADPGEYGWSGMDFFGVDCYQSATNVPYYDNQKMFGFVFDRIHDVYPGIPLMIPEYGIVRNTSTDPTGANRAAAITGHISYLRSRGDVLAIAYFNETGSIPGVPLDDTPSADAWRAALSSQ